MGKNKQVKYKKGKVWFTAIHGVLGMFIFSYNIGVFTPCQLNVAAALEWGENSQRYIAGISALIPLGALTGALFAGYMSHHAGHRKNIIIADLVIITASLITILPTTATFALGRYLSGIGIGIFSVLCPLYLSEISPKDISGKIGSLISVFGCFGSLTAFSLALLLPTENFSSSPMNNFYIIMFLFQGLVALIQLSLFLFHFKYETPMWLLSRGHEKPARKSLKFLYKQEYVSELMENMQASPLLQSSPDKLGNYEFTYKELLTFAPGTRKAMRLGILMSVIQQFSGINAIMSYATTLFMNFGSGLMVARVFTMLTALLKFISCFGLIPLIDCAGRKVVLVVGCIGMALCLGLISAASQLFYIFPIVLIELYLVFFVNSIGPICWMYSGEILCSKGMSICTSINWLSAFVVVLFFPVVNSYIGLNNTFLVFAFVNLVGSGYFFCDMVETKGMTKLEIRDLLAKGNRFDN